MKLTINVTQEDIDKGIRHDCTCCPIAIALNRHFTKSTYVGPWDFGLSSLDLDNPLPFEVAQKIASFDSGNTIRPFTFEITVIHEFIPYLVLQN